MLRCITRVVMGVNLVMPVVAWGAQAAAVVQQKPVTQAQSALSVVVTKDHCTIPGLYGTFQREIGLFIQEFAALSGDVKSRYQLPKPNRNKLMLYGPPGNGKTELAQKIAQLTNSRFMHIQASSIVGTFQNSGAVAIEKYFDDVERFLATTRGTMVMFFDEIDALGSTRNDQSNSNIDTERAMQTLWQYLSKYERTSRIRFVFASNNIKNLPKAFLNRLHDDLVIEINNPTVQARKEIVRNILRMYDVPLLNQEELKRILDRLMKDGI